jgi:hypothetical protein
MTDNRPTVWALNFCGSNAYTSSIFIDTSMLLEVDRKIKNKNKNNPSLHFPNALPLGGVACVN